MMTIRRKLFVIVLMAICLGMLSWGYAGAAGTEDFQKFKTVYISWLDLGENNFASYGYPVKEEWATEIKEQNINGLQKYARDYIKNWEVRGAAAKNEAPPKDPAVLVVKFINLAPFDSHAFSLRCSLQFIDSATGKVLKQVDVEALMRKFGPFSGWANMKFGARLSQGMSNLAYNINYYLTQ